MTHSPGHRRWPGHAIREQRLDKRLRVSVNGKLITDSRDLIRANEDDYPPCFPRGEANMNCLACSHTASRCPFKDAAHQFSLAVGGSTLYDAAWSHEEPYPEQRGPKDRVALYDERYPQLRITD
jgi:uncharacterized protein (DUF427 family)